jgi:hypothetical protein
MRAPVHAMAGNLIWTRSGTVWANWILSGLPYGLRPVKDKLVVRSLHQGLFRALVGESLLLGVRSGLDPAVIGQRMLDGVDPVENPDWFAECEATVQWLDQVEPGQRVFWLAVPLGAASPADRVLEPMRSVRADLQDWLGLPLGGVPAAEVERRAAQAARVAEAIPAVFQPVATTAAQMVWLHQHALRRGLFEDLDLPEGEAGTEVPPKGASALGTPVLDEGGQTDFDPKSPARLNLVGRKYLKVMDANAPAEPTASYQKMLVVSDVPDGGMVFPGSELLGRIDECGQDVDWAMRLTVTSSGEVMVRNQRALNTLNEQYHQRSGEISLGVSVLDRAATDLTEYAAVLEGDKNEVETQATIMFAVAGESPDEVRWHARGVTDYLAAAGYRLAAPLGYQTDLWWSMLPGVTTLPVVREFAQITTSRALAATVPLASIHLGDTKGSVLGLNIGHGPLRDVNKPCGPTDVVMHDLEGASDKQLSGSIAIAGALGAGKTALLMKISGDVVARGGQLVIADKSDKGEWVSWAQGLGRVVVVDPVRPQWSLDPLRIFDPDRAGRLMQSFLTTLLNRPPTSPSGVLLAKVLRRDYLTAHGITSAGALRAHLRDDCKLNGAGDLADLIGVFADQDLGRVVFDPSAPALDLKTRAVVMRTNTLQLPSRAELERGHLFEQLTLEKIFGRALHALLATLAREICFADTSVLGCFVVSEAHAITSSPEGEEVIKEFVREGRKARGAALLDSQDPLEDFGSKTLRGLIPTRIQMRQPDKNLARNGLEWMDMDPTDESLVDLVTRDISPPGPGDVAAVHRRGEALMRDVYGRVGRIKVELPLTPGRAAAITAGGSAAPRARQAIRR